MPSNCKIPAQDIILENNTDHVHATIIYARIVIARQIWTSIYVALQDEAQTSEVQIVKVIYKTVSD